jgi:arsenate reductase-like glutaredoxin family protein
MSNFPKEGDIQATRAWLDKKGFRGKFIDWEADSILGQEKSDIIRLVGNEVEGLRLWGFLNTARQTSAPQAQGK